VFGEREGQFREAQDLAVFDDRLGPSSAQVVSSNSRMGVIRALALGAVGVCMAAPSLLRCLYMCSQGVGQRG
jgi:hypothetical protein